MGYSHRSRGGETLLNNRLLLKGITFVKMYDTSWQEPFCIKVIEDIHKAMKHIDDPHF